MTTGPKPNGAENHDRSSLQSQNPGTRLERFAECDAGASGCNPHAGRIHDQAHHVLPDADPSQVLRFLMEQHGLKQADLADEVGTQSVVSEILNGHRHINTRQAKALAQRFGVSASAFI